MFYGRRSGSGNPVVFAVGNADCKVFDGNRRIGATAGTDRTAHVLRINMAKKKSLTITSMTEET